MSDQKDYKEIATRIIENGFASDMSEDDIKMEMFSNKIPFSKLNSLYKQVAIELGLMVDPKVVTENVNEMLKEMPLDEIEEWHQVESAVQHVVDNVDGATSARVLTLMRTYCKENDIELPKKPKASGGGGPRTSKLSEAVVSLVNKNPNATKQEAYDTLKPLVGGNFQHKNTLYYINTSFALALAAKKGVDLETVISDLKKQPDPEGSDPDPEEVQAKEAEKEEQEEEEALQEMA